MVLHHSDDPQIMILAEGTYPYVRGGVSSWIDQLMKGLAEFRFGIVFLGSRAEDYEEMKYTPPPNLVHLEVHYLFSTNDKGVEPRQIKGNPEAFGLVKELHRWMKEGDGALPEPLTKIDFYTKKVTHEDFLYSKESWRYMTQMYEQNCPDVPFVDYFWTLRSIHAPIWLLANIAANLPSFDLLHSPSTGYAGLLGALLATDRRRPFILTEHGIYTRERKIDLLTADWVTFHKPILLKQPEEFNYIKQMWVNFFERIGEFCYRAADPIISLYSGARELQIRFGAPKERTMVVPNGIDVDGLMQLLHQRGTKRPIITLIGRVVSIKDIKTFIRAMRITANSVEDVEGWIAGPTDESPDYFIECQNMVEALGLQNNVKFLGYCNIRDILPQSHLLTLTSISEGMPLVILEGFAAGLPCVATDVGSCRDLIEGGIDEEDRAIGCAGAVTPIADPAALADRYIHFLTNDTAWSEAQQAALKRVDRFYRQELFFKTYRDLYNKAMSR